MSQILSGKEAAAYYKAAVQQQVKDYEQTWHTKPVLAIVIPQIDAASRSYLASRQKIAQELGIEIRSYVFDTIDQSALFSLVQQLNQEKDINGIIVDRPFPKEIEEQTIYDLIDVHKDVDGCGVVNAGLLMQGKEALYPSTAQAVIALLDYYQINLKGENVVVVGRSKTVGMPVAKMLLDRHATVTICHSRTNNLTSVCQQASLLVVAIGKKKMIDAQYTQANSIVIDVGIHYEKEGLCGDVDHQVYPLVKAYSPVPGGIGPLTSMMLMSNVMKSAQKRKR